MGDDNGVNGDLNANSTCQSTGDPQLDKVVHQWLSWDKNPRTRAQVESLVAADRHDDLRKRLCSRMSFGTAGLRAAMGAGFNRINDLTVIQSTQGLYSYLSRYFADFSSRGVVVGYDTRGQEESGCSSKRLAKLTAAVMLSRDVTVHLFSSFVPTPYVPYAVKKLGAVAGVMITASHNPKEDNGYKVYWCNGAQISAPHDKEILRAIEEQLEPWSASCWEEELVESNSLRTDPLTQINSRYMEELTSLCFHRDLNRSSPLKFVHSSFHGVGHDFVHQAFLTFGFAPPIPVLEQKDPDPNFPSVRCPNPEEGESVLELSLRLAEKERAEIVLATDPDADRLAVAERSDRCSWKVFTGNELAALLGWWMFFNWKEAHPDPADSQRVYMLATTVSSKILQAFARIEGFHFEETLPGFKWIGNKIHELTKTGNTVLFAFEESIGFLCGGLVPEKDGVSAAVVVAEMAAYLLSKNLSLGQQLLNIYQTYGHHLSKTSYVVCNDPPTIQKIFSRIRNFEGKGLYPKVCGGVQVVHVRDVTTGYDSSQPDLRSVLPVTKSSHMITLTLQNGVVATLRTSGTEPKIKYYTEYCAAPGVSEVSQLEEELRKITTALLDDFLEPERNNLIRRSV
ncbi:glucose 1%2C6-bisphosphate synthase isoform X1 [Xyrichtys novacula]|uniref:Glucose 1,6-bisphosphate synthase isoform X1 n=1 Tax=Xyrichtys novacula TaxID=13765 RepID=A0AAV1FZM2_XYRNO|nr:glucose 1%2C6-bisphosphate synthase isoform X1 [Xyrichtys novacula]